MPYRKGMMLFLGGFIKYCKCTAKQNYTWLKNFPAIRNDWKGSGLIWWISWHCRCSNRGRIWRMFWWSWGSGRFILLLYILSYLEFESYLSQTSKMTWRIIHQKSYLKFSSNAHDINHSVIYFTWKNKMFLIIQYHVTVR